MLAAGALEVAVELVRGVIHESNRLLKLYPASYKLLRKLQITNLPVGSVNDPLKPPL